MHKPTNKDMYNANAAQSFYHQWSETVFGQTLPSKAFNYLTVTLATRR